MSNSPQPPSYDSTAEYSSTARSLALDISPSQSPNGQSARPPWRRAESASSDAVRFNRWATPAGTEVPFHRRALATTHKYFRWSMRAYERLTPLQQFLLSAFGIASIVLAILALIYSDQLFGWLTPIADRWKELPGGWVILWVATFLTAFPPMFGYSTCVTLGGFVFGMKGWFIVSTANVIGSFCAFMLFRHLLSGFAKRLAAKDPLFAAFGMVVEKDGLPIVMLIRLTPLPYSLSNGGLSTVQTIKPWQFVVATAVAAPKLLIHVFVGKKLKELAGGDLDTSTKLVNWASIAFGIALGAITGIVIYRRTMARVKVLEAEQQRRAEAEGAPGLEHPDEFMDDVDPEAIDVAEDVIDFIDGRYVDDVESQVPSEVRKYTDAESDVEGGMDGTNDIRLTRTTKH